MAGMSVLRENVVQFVFNNREQFTKAAVAVCLAGLTVGCADTAYRVERLIPDSPVHGVNGMEFDSDGYLIASSMAGAEIYRIDVQTGQTETLVSAPQGLGDGLAIGPDGTMAWTALPAAEVRALRPDGEIVVLASGLSGINSIKFSRDGKLYAAQVRADDAVYEIDVNGEKPARLVARGMDCPADALCGLNSFDISDSNILYGPLMASGAITRIDLDDGKFSEAASGLDQPTGARLDSHGALYALNWLEGTLVRVDLETQAKEIVAKLPPPLDNLTIGPGGSVYVSNPVHNVIFAVNPDTGATQRILEGGLVMPGDVAIMQVDGRETLLVTGVFGYRQLDIETGAMTPPVLSDTTHASFAIDSKGGIVATTDYRSGTVRVLDYESGKMLQVMSDFNTPYQVRLLDDGGLLLAEFGSGSVLHIGPGGSRRVVTGGLGGPVGLAMADKDAAYVTESTAGIVSRIRLSDGDRIIVAEGLQQPEGIAIDHDGRIIVAETGARRLIVIDPTSGAYDTIAGDLPIGLAPYTGPEQAGLRPFIPTGVALGGTGEIFVVSDIEHTILRIFRR
jgi:sugar lactone lactonase YvrE